MFSRRKEPPRLSTILYILLLGAIMVPIALISVSVLNMYKRDLIQQTTDRTMQTLRAVTYSEQQEIQQFLNFSAAIGMDKLLLSTASLLKSPEQSGQRNYQKELHQSLDKYVSVMSGKVQSINFFYKGGGVYSYLKDLRKSEAEVRKTEWYQKAADMPDQVHFVGVQYDYLYNVSESESIVTAIAPSSLQGLHEIEVITFVFSIDAIQQVLLQHPYSESSVFYVLDPFGKIIASSGLGNVSMDLPVLQQIFSAGEGSFRAAIAGEDRLLTHSAVDIAGWQVVHSIPYRNLTENYDRIFRIVLIATTVIAILSAIIAINIVRLFTRPLHLLTLKMSRVMNGNLRTKIEESGTREMVQVARTFNHMMGEINRLIEEREKEEKAKRKAEFAALQSQINPHFLINTLNSIRLMALINREENIRRMTHALIRLLSSSFNRGSSLTRFSDEIENLREYLFIMETRYGNIFRVVWDIDPRTEPLYILKLLLQPILENSIVHGMSGKMADGLICIRSRQLEDALLISIEDNGEGIPREKMEELYREKNEDAFSGMGIRNVHRRIQLHYGSDFGVAFDAKPEGGTVVHIRVPVIERDEER